MNMETADTPVSYSFFSKLTHWVMAILIIGLTTVGFIISNLPKDYVYKMPLVLAHKSLGGVALILGPLTILWALFRRYTPRYPSTMNIVTIFLARIVKLALMLVMIVMPLSGYIMATSEGRIFGFFNLFNYPSLINATAANGAIAYKVHVFIAPIIAVLIGIHILAALKHHYIDRDEVLKRMLF